MLSSQHLLKNGRYSIERSVCTGPAGTIYMASDTLRKTTVAVIERRDGVGNDNFDGVQLARTQHDGLVRINDDFEERSCRYSATEPLSTQPVKLPENGAECYAFFDRLGVALLALNAVRAEVEATWGGEISPETVVLTAEGKLKLLYAGSSGFTTASFDVTSPYASLESVWENLDHITQKAIYNSYEDSSLALLESPADSRTDIYSLGAIFYRLLTGKDPAPAVERAIEMLDSNADSLRSPKALNPAVNADQSDFIMRMLEVRREQRFGSIEDAIFSLPASPAPVETVVETKQVVPEPEDFPLLEIPAVPVAHMTQFAANGLQPKAAVQVLETPSLGAAEAFRPPFQSVEATPEQAFPTVANPEPRDAHRPTMRVDDDKEVFASFGTHEAVSGAGPMKAIAIGAGAIVVAIGIGIGMFGGFGSKVDVTPAPSMTVPQKVEDEQPATETPPAIESENVVAETENGANVDPTAKPKPQIAETRAKPAKDVKPAAKNGAKPAKKLTVDDLIN